MFKPSTPYYSKMDWIELLAAQSGYSQNIFWDLLYTMDGRILHVIYRFPEKSELAKLPKQKIRRHEMGGTVVFETMCHCYVQGSLMFCEEIGDIAAQPCRRCLSNLPGYACEKALAETAGIDFHDWLHRAMLRRRASF